MIHPPGMEWRHRRCREVGATLVLPYIIDARWSTQGGMRTASAPVFLHTLDSAGSWALFTVLGKGRSLLVGSEFIIL